MSNLTPRRVSTPPASGRLGIGARSVVRNVVKAHADDLSKLYELEVEIATQRRELFEDDLQLRKAAAEESRAEELRRVQEHKRRLAAIRKSGSTSPQRGRISPFARKDADQSKERFYERPTNTSMRFNTTTETDTDVSIPKVSPVRSKNDVMYLDSPPTLFSLATSESGTGSRPPRKRISARDRAEHVDDLHKAIREWSKANTERVGTAVEHHEAVMGDAKVPIYVRSSSTPEPEPVRCRRVSQPSSSRCSSERPEVHGEKRHVLDDDYDDNHDDGEGERFRARGEEWASKTSNRDKEFEYGGLHEARQEIYRKPFCSVTHRDGVPTEEVAGEGHEGSPLPPGRRNIHQYTPETEREVIKEEDQAGPTTKAPAARVGGGRSFALPSPQRGKQAVRVGVPHVSIDVDADLTARYLWVSGVGEREREGTERRRPQSQRRHFTPNKCAREGVSSAVTGAPGLTLGYTPQSLSSSPKANKMQLTHARKANDGSLFGLVEPLITLAEERIRSAMIIHSNRCTECVMALLSTYRAQMPQKNDDEGLTTSNKSMRRRGESLEASSLAVADELIRLVSVWSEAAGEEYSTEEVASYHRSNDGLSASELAYSMVMEPAQNQQWFNTITQLITFSTRQDVRLDLTITAHNLPIMKVVSRRADELASITISSVLPICFQLLALRAAAAATTSAEYI